MGRSKSTISRELRRNKGNCGYRYQCAHIKAQRCHQDKPNAIKLDEAMKQIITPLIEEKWSPEQISGRLKRLEKPSISNETIYRLVLTNKAAGDELSKHLRHQAKPYRKR